jgi:hypothetical protein
VEEIHGVSLKKRNLDWFAMIAMHNACALAKHFNRAGPRTAPAKNVRVENTQGRTAQVAGSNAFDKSGNIDVGGAGRGAGRVKAVQAAVSLNDGCLRRKRRLQFAETLAQLLIVW